MNSYVKKNLEMCNKFLFEEMEKRSSVVVKNSKCESEMNALKQELDDYNEDQQKMISISLLVDGIQKILQKLLKKLLERRQKF